MRAVGASALLVLLAAIAPAGALATAPTITHTTVSEVSPTSATLEAEVNPEGLETSVRFEYGTVECSASACKKTAPQSAGSGKAKVPVKAMVTGLAPGTVYFMRAVANNGTIATGPDHTFATYSALTPEGLPEGRAYEQATPVNKDGGDAQGRQVIVKASESGNAVSFGSAFGMPGGVGAQALPSFLATRGSDWSTQGLLPPELFGQRAQVLGWTPDYSKTFSSVTKLGNPRTKALLMQSTDGAPPVLLTPYLAKAEYSYAGTSAGGSTVFFESEVKLPPKEGQPPIAEAIEGASNVYVWDEASGEVHLAGAMNTAKETGEALAKGAFAGPYNWGVGITPNGLSLGGAHSGYYLQEGRAITSSGDVYFTAAGSGQLYLRENPTQKQSAVDVNGKCTQPELACTIHVSATEKTNGKGLSKADPAGSQPAAFQAASEDGSKVFFTSPEMLTNNARTGPEQPEAQIGLGSVGGGVEKADFIPAKAVGVAVDGSHVYWADPADGTIGRANLDGSGKEKEFIAPPAGECEVEVNVGPGEYKMVKETIPSTPRYLAVDGEYIYWTNTGIPEDNSTIFHSGSIGRAKLNGEAASVEPDFICGASNPQGIAVNATHIYWANASQDPTKRWISRAKLDGSEAVYKFIEPFGTPHTPYGIALSADHIYYAINDEPDNLGFIARVPLTGGTSDGVKLVGEAGMRAITVDASHVYWAAKNEEAIGRAELDLENPETAFLPLAGKPVGLAEDAAHLYWSVNGEAPTNPGNDLYRYEPASGALTDLTPGSPDLGANGAEVQGMVGASADGSRLYFVANGDLDGPAGPAKTGDCQTSQPHGLVTSTTGQCNLYLLHEGTFSLIARLHPGGGQSTSDVLDWVPSPRELFGTSGYVGKTAFLTADGKTLLFRSNEQLTAFENEGASELYRYREGDPAGIRCASCRPSGEKAAKGPGFEAVHFPVLGPRADINAVASRILSADGNHAFFETAEALSPADTNGEGCALFASSPSCLDVYEWTATGSGECTEGSAAYSLLNQGCVYLISTGESKYPSFFADASQSGKDVFFFTRQSLVGQDEDELQDVYDARVGGGIASQNPSHPVPCESTDSCHGPAQETAAESTPATPTFHGPGNETPQRKKPKHKAKHHKKQKQKKRRARAGAKGRASR